MALIGIFWIHNGTVIGKPISIDAGEENIPGIVDSPDIHVKCWEHEPGFLKDYPELQGTDYQLVPRGRVLYSKTDRTFNVYMDSTLFTEKVQAAISAFFGFDGAQVQWEAEEHYTTDADAIDALFED